MERTRRSVTKSDQSGRKTKFCGNTREGKIKRDGDRDGENKENFQTSRFKKIRLGRVKEEVKGQIREQGKKERQESLQAIYTRI